MRQRTNLERWVINQEKVFGQFDTAATFFAVIGCQDKRCLVHEPDRNAAETSEEQGSRPVLSPPQVSPVYFWFFFAVLRRRTR